jgi:predicted RNA binding protein YcfA (HicA-like mRNA interferase family)
MPEIKPQKYRDIVKKLKKSGFVFKRNTGGSHEIWWSEKRRKTCVVPHHKEIKAGTVKSILKQINVSYEEFIKK